MRVMHLAAFSNFTFAMSVTARGICCHENHLLSSEIQTAKITPSSTPESYFSDGHPNTCGGRCNNCPLLFASPRPVHTRESAGPILPGQGAQWSRSHQILQPRGRVLLPPITSSK